MSDLAPGEAERRIRGTRAELALTLDALQQKLAAQRLVEKGVDMFKDTIGGTDWMKSGLDAIRANPIPVALIGAGAVWLIADRLLQDPRAEQVKRRVADLGQRAGALASQAGRPLGLTGNAMVDEAGAPRPDGWTHQVAGMAQGAINSVRDSGGAMLNRAGTFASDGAGKVSDRLSDAVQRHPLALGAVGALAGALAAALLPLSRVEDDMLGGTRDEIQRRLRETASRAIGAAADAAADTVRDALDHPSHP
ncbi:MAG TPA: DUF3618 domain-containing protein [Stellaceae bacterium]|nr:DUF3618 domain-containing protein [Stellaceae bacterium]